MNTKQVGEADLRRIAGDIDDAAIVEILALQPTVGDLEEAVVWTAGDGDALGRQGRPLAGTVSEIVEILTANDDEPTTD